MIEQHLVNAVVAAGGETRKMQWIGLNGAPDRLVILNGHVAFVELKATGETPSHHQIKEHRKLRDAGALVFVFDSLEEADWLIKEFKNGIA